MQQVLLSEILPEESVLQAFDPGKIIMDLDVKRRVIAGLPTAFSCSVILQIQHLKEIIDLKQV